MKVSVSLITYNHERYIAQALEGVLMQQTDFDYEIVVGEDCSTDGTREIVREYQARYPEKIRTILPERNLGQGGMRILVETLRAARGEYVARLDGDDYWTSPHKLQRQVDFLQSSHRECSMCFHNVLAVHEDGSAPPYLYTSADQKRFTDTRDILWQCYIAGCSPMFRREVVDALPHWYFDVKFGDWPLHITAGELGKIGYLDETMGVWRIHGNGFWSGRSRVHQFEGIIDFYRVVNRGTNHRYAKLLSGYASYWYYWLAAAHLEQNDHRQARDAAWRALRSEPLGRHFSRIGLLRTLAASYMAPARNWLRQRRPSSTR